MPSWNIRRWLVLVGAVVGEASALAPPARACSYELCSLAHVAPSGGGIPANAPALVYVAPPPLDTTPATSVLLTTLGGQALPFTFEPDPTGPGQFLIHPSVSLEVGAIYRLIGVGDCGSDARTEPGARFNAAFAVDPPANLPTNIGPAKAFPPQILEMEVPYASECTSIRHVSTVYYETSVADLAPFLATTSSVLRVDGQVWRTSDYGQNLPAPYQVCDGDNEIAMGLGAGHHHAELSIHVAGATIDPPPVSFEFDLDCAAYHGPGSSGGGCALGAGRSAGGDAWPWGLALLAAALRAARARRASR